MDFSQINKSIDMKQLDLKWSFWFEETISSSGTTWDPVYKEDVSTSGTAVEDSEMPWSGPMQIALKPPSPDEGPTKQILWASNWDAYGELQQAETEVINQMETYVANTYTKFESGALNNTEVLSQVNMLNNLLADVNTSDGSFSEVTSFLAATGMTTPDLDNTSYMDIRYQEYKDEQATELKTNVTLQGLLASTSEPPTGSWETNNTYDTENLEGSQTVALVDGGIQSLDGEFEIQTVYTEDGSATDNVSISTDTRDYGVSNTTELQNRTAMLQDQIDQLQELQRSASSGGGGGSLFGGGFSWPDLPGFDSLPNPFAMLGGLARQFVVLVGIGIAGLLALKVVTQ
jgi:hypothetical protein